jgi:hypothetical protein
VLGPKITEVSADELKNELKAVIMNHNDEQFDERLKLIRKEWRW